jgi:predicted Rossmann fold flavoprotein
MSTETTILGAGAAGLMCAIEAGKRGKKVLLIEHTDKPGKKILISGGGRCNFTNVNTTSDNFISSNLHFCKSALSQYTPQDFISLVEKYKIKYYEKKLGQLFCNGSSKLILDMLLNECKKYGVEIVTDCQIKEVSRENDFIINTNLGVYESKSLVIATGGISIPKMGATDIGYKIAKHFKLKIINPTPALVPLTSKGNELKLFSGLSGVSLFAKVSTGKTSFEENILFTHKGLSGPAILQISSYWKKGDKIILDLRPGKDIKELLKKEKSKNTELHNFLSKHLPSRFSIAFCNSYLKSKQINLLSQTEINQLSNLIHHWQLSPSGTEGFAKAEVTKGGVDTKELSSKTMECKTIPGLFFIGEVVDVTGQLGGYNFQWAWSSGFVAGKYC